MIVARADVDIHDGFGPRAGPAGRQPQGETQRGHGRSQTVRIDSWRTPFPGHHDGPEGPSSYGSYVPG